MNAEQWQVVQTMSLVYARNAMVATMTLLILEFFQHLELERTLVWTSKWNACKCLYLISRYLPLGILPAWLFYSSAPHFATMNGCEVLFDVNSILMAIICLCADAVLYLRVYALSLRSKGMRTVLTVNYVAVVLVCLTSISLFVRHQVFVYSPNLLSLTACFGISTRGAKVWSVVCYGALIYSAAFTTSLSLWYGVRLYLSMQPTPPGFVLIKIFYVDGAFYFISISVISVANIMVSLLAPPQYRNLLPIAQTVVHSVLASRMVLHLREVAQVSAVGSNSDRLDVNHAPWGISVLVAAFKATSVNSATKLETAGSAEAYS